MEYNLGQKYKYLSGKWGMKRGTNLKGSAMFKIYADGKKIYESPAMDPKTDPINFTVDVTGCKYLKIKVVALQKEYKTNSGRMATCYDYDEFRIGNLKLYRK